MKKLNSPLENILYLGYRLTTPVFDPVKLLLSFYRYPKYIYEAYKYSKLSKNVKLNLKDLYPILDENTPYTKFDYHYFYQQLWVFENILASKPNKHVDVGSTYEMSGYISKVTNAEFVDIRPISVNIPNLTIIKGSITQLPYESNSIESLSCLHVLEHIGLGRYGDTIDPDGINKGIQELSRVLKPGGSLYVSTPIGVARVCFNAHRVSDPEFIVSSFNGLKLQSFYAVNDSGILEKDLHPTDLKCAAYALGLYKFTKE